MMQSAGRLMSLSCQRCLRRRGAAVVEEFPAHTLLSRSTVEVMVGEARWVPGGERCCVRTLVASRGAREFPPPVGQVQSRTLRRPAAWLPRLHRGRGGQRPF